MKNRESVALNVSRWSAYSAAGFAAATAGTMTSEAEAGIIWSGEINVPLNPGAGTFIASLGAGGSLLAAVQSLAPGVGVGLAVVINGTLAGFSSFGYPYASNLAYGAQLSTANFGLLQSQTATLAFASGYGNDQFLDQGGFIGFRFNVAGGTQYGWAELEVDTGSPANTYILKSFAYGDVGESVFVGQIPGPGSMAALALGAAGLGGFRKRRSA